MNKNCDQQWCHLKALNGEKDCIAYVYIYIVYIPLFTPIPFISVHKKMPETEQLTN